jgi:[ribosomal protein S5]-alanine N-acetyltransferase
MCSVGPGTPSHPRKRQVPTSHPWKGRGYDGLQNILVASAYRIGTSHDFFQHVPVFPSYLSGAVLSTVADLLDIRTQRLVLRRFRPEDLPEFLLYRNDPEVTRFDGLDHITPEEANDLIERQAVLPAGAPGHWLQIAIELPGEGLIGDCGFRVDDVTVGTAEVGYRLKRECWGKGYGSEAVGGVLQWAFDILGLHRVIALIDTRNAASIALVERLGFRREGAFQQSYREGQGWSDEYLYAILEDEWRAGD